MEKKEKNSLIIKILKWVGIIFTALFGIIMFGGDKITSGIILMITAIIMILPIKKNQLLRKIRIGFICIIFCFVAWNISTTDLPTDFGMISVKTGNTSKQVEFTSTGIRFIDQLHHIFNGFLEGRVFVKEPNN